MRALSWSPIPSDCELITPTVWFNGGTVGKEAAAACNAKPAGSRAIASQGMERDLVDYDTPRGPWLEKGIAVVKARWLKFLTEFAAAGGQCDYLFLDPEVTGYLTNWRLTPEQMKAIDADPRSKALKKALRITDLQTVLNWRGSPNYLTWNAYVQGVVAAALNEAVYEVAKKFFPKIQCNNYDDYTVTKANVVPDLNGHMQWSVRHTGTHGCREFYGWMGGLQFAPLVRGKPLGFTGFSVLLWHVKWMRAIYRSAPAVPFHPCVSHQGFNGDQPLEVKGSAYRGPYYQELIYHLAFYGVRDVVYWNPKSIPPDKDASPEDDRLLNACLREVNSVTGGKVLKPSSTLTPRWDAQLIVSSSGDLHRVSVPEGVGSFVVRSGGKKRVQPVTGAGAWVKGRGATFALK